MMIRSSAGISVQTTSSVEAWISRSTGVACSIETTPKRRIATASTYLTKQRIAVRKILRSSWKAMIPSAIGDAGVWKPLCQGRAGSAATEEKEVALPTTERERIAREGNTERSVRIWLKKCAREPIEAECS